MSSENEKEKDGLYIIVVQQMDGLMEVSLLSLSAPKWMTISHFFQIIA